MPAIFMALLFFLFSFLCPFQMSYASKARMDALGGEETALYYFNDSRNMFINPAFVNVVKDFVIFEWGKNVDAPESNQYNPKPEGGVIKSLGSFVYGVYLGNEEGYTNRNLIGSTPPTVLNQTNAAEVFLGGDAGINWGASLKYAQSQDEQTGVNRSQNSLTIRYGMMIGKLETFFKAGLWDKSKGGATSHEEFRNELNLQAGVDYLFDPFVAYALISQDGYEYKRSEDGKIDQDYLVRALKIGGGQSFQADEKTKIYFDLNYYLKKEKKRENLATTGTKYLTSTWRVPLTIGLESSVEKWLTLRGSISQNLLSSTKDRSRRSKTERSTTEVNGGASLLIGKMKLDGLIGTTDSSGGENKKGLLSASNLMTRVSMSYWF